MDSDWHAMMETGGITIDEAPFSPISKESFEKNLELIEKSDLVILANLSVGVGNILNLKAALKAEGGKLLVVDKTPFDERNFAGIEAEKLYKSIIAKARVFKNEGEVLNAVEVLLKG